MKISILLSSAILFATALIPMSAYADDQNLLCRRSGNECGSLRGSGSGKLSISGLDINVKSSDRGNRNRNASLDRNAEAGPNDKKNNDSNDSGAENDSTVDNANSDTNDNTVDSGKDTPDTGNDNADAGTDTGGNTENADAGTDTGGDTNNNNPNGPGHNNRDFANEGYNPYGGLYGPGT